MATSIVDTLFGISPERLEQQRAADADARALQYAKLNPFEQANFAIGRGAYGLAGALGGALGGQDPELQRVTMRQQILGTIDPSRPETFDSAAQAALEAGDQELAFGLKLEAPKFREQARIAQRNQQTELLAQQTAAQEQRAAQLVGQLKNADGTVNQTVLAELQTFPQGMAAIKSQADILPAIRRLGAVGAAEVNPFAAFTDDQTIPKNVQTYAKQLSKSFADGILDPEKVDARVKELADMTQRADQYAQTQAQIKAQQEQSNEFRRQGLANSEAALQLARSTKALQVQNAQFERDRKEEERKNKPLPPNLQKQEEDDFQLAQATSNLAMDANNFINRIKRGEIKFGLKDRATISTMSLFGSNDPDVLARQDYDKFVERLTSENLRLNKGVQTDKDFERELNLLKSAESAGSAAQIMKNLVDINLRKTADAAKSIERRRNNAGFAPPRTPIDLPILDIQIITPTEEKSFLANPKFPEGTVYINPQGIRTVKTLKR
jgi:hypothetical protein